MQSDEERLERLLADLRGRLDAFIDHLDAAAQGEDDERYARLAERARTLRSELDPPDDAESATEPVRDVLLAALREAHQPLRESVLYERVRERGAAVAPDEFVAVAYDLVTRGLVRVAVEHDLPSRDPPPFQPRFYRPAT
jgi:hypothetical protein